MISGDLQPARDLNAKWETSIVPSSLIDGPLAASFESPRKGPLATTAAPTMVVSSVGSSTSPVAWVRIDREQQFRFIRACQKDTKANIVSAPKMRLFNGQSGSIVDESQRPFVTGITPIRDGDASTYEPVIQIAAETFVNSVETQGTMKPQESLLIAVPTPFAREAPKKESTAMYFMVTPRWSRGRDE